MLGSTHGALVEAMRNPFSISADGARFPDTYARPSTTSKFRSVFQVTSSSSGNASFMFVPDLYATVYDPTGSAVNGANAGMLSYVGAGAPTGKIYAACSTGALSATYQVYRHVVGGLRIRNQVPPLNATGKVIISRVPTSGQRPGPATLGTADYATHRIIDDITGINIGANNNFPQSILELPDSAEFSAQEIISTAAEIIARPCTPDAYRWRSADNAASFTSTASLAGGAEYTNATGVVFTIADALFSNVSTHDAIIVSFFNFPASTTIAEVEMVIRVEGVPAFYSGAGQGIVPDGVRAAERDPTFLDRLLSRVSVDGLVQAVNTPAGRQLLGAASSYLTRNRRQPMMIE